MGKRLLQQQQEQNNPSCKRFKKQIQTTENNQKGEELKKKRHRITKSARYAPKDGPKAAGVLEKRRLRKQQKRLQRNKQKSTKKEAKEKSQNLNDKKNKVQLKFLDDFLSRDFKSQPLRKKQIDEFNQMVAQLKSHDFAIFCDKIIKFLSDPKVHNERLKSYLLDKLGYVLRSGHVSDNSALIFRGLIFFALNAFFVPNEKAKDLCQFSDRLRQYFRNNLHRLLCVIFKSRHHIFQTETVSTKKVNPNAHLVILNQLIEYLNKIISKTKSNYVCVEAKSKTIFENILKSQKELRQKLKEIKKEDKKASEDKKETYSKASSIFNAFITFYDLLLLYVFEDAVTTEQTYTELEECLARAKQEVLESEEYLKKSEKIDQPKWADVLTDIIISYLLKPSQLIRTAVTSVFSLIKQFISKEAIEQICLALVSDENEEEQEELDDEEVEDEEFDEAYENRQSIDKENGNEEKSENDLASDDEEENEDGFSDDTDGDDTEEEESDQEIDEEFRKKLKSALGKAAIDSDEDNNEDEQGKDDIEENKLDEYVLNDDDMLKFDKALADVFRERKNLKKINKNVEHLEFKSRCLDLVEDFVTSKGTSLSQLLLFANNLLDMNKKSLSNKTIDLIQRSSHILSLMVKSKNKIQLQVSDNAQEIKEQLLNLFNQAIEISSACQDKKIQDNLYNFCNWCIQVSKQCELDHDWNSKIKELIEKFFKSNNFKLSTTFFIRLLNQKELVKQIFTQFNAELNENIRPFKKTAAYQVLIYSVQNADEEDIKDVDEKFLEQHTKTANNLLLQFKKSNSLLFNNIFLFLLILLDKSDSVLGKNELNHLISNLSKFAQDTRCKRTLSKEVKTKLRKLKSTLQI